jgi:Na+-driven multidrug efflux pump
MFALWVPLAASITIMVVEPSIIAIGLGRSTDQELALAAYGVAYSLALLVEAPILMLIDASVALSANLATFAIVRRFTVLIGLAVTGVGLALSLTPLYGLIVVGLMRIPPDIAAWARPTMVLLSFWSFPIAWRRTYQGVLIRAGHTTVITAATVVRLFVLSIVLFAGLALWPDEGAVLAGAAMVLSVTVEALLITWAARPVLRLASFGSPAGESRQGPLTLRRLWTFYRPLVVTSLLRQGTRPVLNAAIASMALPRASLAAWPVAWGLATLIAGPAWSFQQLTTALTTSDAAFRRVWRFSMALSWGMTLLLAVIAFTPLYEPVLGGIYNLSADLMSLARPAVGALVLLPLLQGAQSVYRGSLIRHGCTRAVRTATLCNVVVLVAVCLLAVPLVSATGVLLAATASMISGAAELVWLWREKPRC